MADSFIIYKKKKALFNKLSCEQAGQLIKAIFQFQENGERPEDAMIDLLLEDFVVDFEKAADIREKRKKSGKQGAERRWAKTTQTKKTTPSVSQQSQPSNVLFDVSVSPTANNTVKKPNLTEIKEYWNANIKGNVIPKISKIQHDRAGKVNARFKEYGREGIITVISKVANSRFLNSGTFHVTFDWVFSPNNFPKILDGNFDNDKVNNKKSSNATSALDVFNQVFNDGNNSTEPESTIDIEATVVG